MPQRPIATGRWQALLLVYALFASACFKILLPEVKITWLLYVNLILLYVWPYLTRPWHTNIARALPIPKLNTDGWQALLLAYVLFLGACLLVVVHGKKLWTLYTCLIIPWSWRYLPEFWKLVKASRLYQLILVYLGFLLASMFWSPQIETKSVLSTLASAITIAHFVLLTAGLRVHYHEAFDRQLSRLGFLAAASAVLVIAAWYSRHPFPQSRMEGFGYLDNPIEAAAVFGLFGVIAWHRWLSFAAGRFAYSLILAIVVVYACLSWTRSVLIALAIALIAIAMLHPNRRGQLALSIGGTTMALTLAFLAPELSSKLLRPEPYRPAIWTEAITQALSNPWLGHGYFADPSGMVELPDGTLYHYFHTHNFFIANFFTGGIVGLGLAFGLVGLSLYQTLRHRLMTRNILAFALLIYGFLCIFPNGWEILPGVRIREVWLIFWLPLGLAVSEELLMRKHSLPTAG